MHARVTHFMQQQIKMMIMATSRRKPNTMMRMIPTRGSAVS
jgi:hypothetical protein